MSMRRRVSQPTRWTQRVIESKFSSAYPSSTPREDVLSMELYESIDVWQLHFMWLEEQQASEHEDVKCSKVTMKTPLMYLHPLSSVLTNIPFPSTLGDMG